jgi:hypothetical protein
MFSDTVADALSSIISDLENADPDIYTKAEVVNMMGSMAYIIALSDSMDSSGKITTSRTKLKQNCKSRSEQVYDNYAPAKKGGINKKRTTKKPSLATKKTKKVRFNV